MDEYNRVLHSLMRERRRIIRWLNREDTLRSPHRQKDIDRATEELERELEELRRRLRNPLRW